MDFINNLKLTLEQKEYISKINDKIHKEFPSDLYDHTISTLLCCVKLANKYILNDDVIINNDESNDSIRLLDSNILNNNINNNKNNNINNNNNNDDNNDNEIYYKLCISAMLHDYGKIFSLEKLKEIALKNKNELNATEEDLDIISILHGFAGAFIIRDEFNINDEEILNSVKYHTIGYCNMSILDKIIYISDKIEERRNYKEVFYLRELSLKNINLCLLEVYKNNIIYIIRNNKKIYSYTCKIWNNICELYGGL
ncbi:MAG: bis(5'-nucleosyl)-tetraphosphatase (symmetrical) YqeK [Actinobacteria bacterium]|nr:bis(5'-nucleosyl)-tetraphosphatase (symmetrical) YqeK [Cyanobacteriota bacterium]MCL5771097.1 bis(5'-nucleosyl)-tetraphosphatase (symmetrical) YqeK [Actinomycetota bacterium]